MSAGKVLVDSGVYKQSELEAKANIARERYTMTVQMETETLLNILNKNIIPRAYAHANTLPDAPKNSITNRRKDEFLMKLNNLLEGVASLEEKLTKDLDLPSYEKLRQEVNQVGELANEVTDHLPNCPEWPELHDILRRF